MENEVTCMTISHFFGIKRSLNYKLVIQNVRKFNQALLGKWLWQYAHEKGAWWRSVFVVTQIINEA
jgi:hypothetical protein